MHIPLWCAQGDVSSFISFHHLSTICIAKLFPFPSALGGSVYDCYSRIFILFSEWCGLQMCRVDLFICDISRLVIIQARRKVTNPVTRNKKQGTFCFFPNDKDKKKEQRCDQPSPRWLFICCSPLLNMYQTFLSPPFIIHIQVCIRLHFKQVVKKRKSNK